MIRNIQPTKRNSNEDNKTGFTRRYIIKISGNGMLLCSDEMLTNKYKSGESGDLFFKF